jgi:hypothetical protein
MTIELLAWVDARERTYEEVLEAWTSNCPRHPVWDDALSDGLVRVVRGDVTLTPSGRAVLDAAP